MVSAQCQPKSSCVSFSGYCRSNSFIKRSLRKLLLATFHTKEREVIQKISKMEDVRNTQDINSIEKIVLFVKESLA